MKKQKGRWWKDVGLFKQNMKPYISSNESKGILNRIVGCSSFPTMGTMRKMDLL
jgi:hypothetical protein